MPPKFSAIPFILSAFKTRHRRSFADLSLDKPGKILLVKQAERLGNIILMNSAISGLAEKYPNLKIDLLLPAPYAEVMKANSHINGIIPALKREYISKPWMFVALIRKLRLGRYDLAIDCSDVNSHSATGAAYALLSGARLTAGWKIMERKIFDIEIERYSDIIHATQMYQRLFSGILGTPLEGQPYFDGFPSSNSDRKAVVGLNCGGRGTKRWPLKSFIEVGKQLSSQGMEVDFILGPEENALRDELKGKLPEGCHLLPLLPLAALMKTISGYRAFISSDTGPMHLAWCLRVPTVAIFLDSELEKFKPLSPGSMAIDGQNGIEPGEIVVLAANIVKSGKVSA
jgi:ADP-heptose:LPS heptosyltransferase